MQSPAPNLLILLSDQLRRQALSCYGDPNIQTPQIDRLASEGSTFTNACATEVSRHHELLRDRLKTTLDPYEL